MSFQTQSLAAFGCGGGCAMHPFLFLAFHVIPVSGWAGKSRWTTVSLGTACGLDLPEICSARTHVVWWDVRPIGAQSIGWLGLAVPKHFCIQAGVGTGDMNPVSCLRLEALTGDTWTNATSWFAVWSRHVGVAFLLWPSLMVLFSLRVGECWGGAR